MGLPGSGKTTLATALVEALLPDCLWLNADAIRREYNDWDFSVDGRIRQSERMRDLANSSQKQYVICDFIAPLQIMRDIFSADIVVWVDTEQNSIYEDTNRIFVKPEKCDIRVSSKDATYWSIKILNIIDNLNKEIKCHYQSSI